jgi:hypothetical protein
MHFARGILTRLKKEILLSNFLLRRLAQGRWFWLTAGLTGWAAIIILSLLPGSARPHGGVGGVVEHFSAYALVAFSMVLGFDEVRRWIWVAPILAGVAAILEIVQIYIPGRNADVTGFLSALAGAFIGMATAKTIAHCAERQLGN